MIQLILFQILTKYNTDVFSNFQMIGTLCQAPENDPFLKMLPSMLYRAK